MLNTTAVMTLKKSRQEKVARTRPENDPEMKVEVKSIFIRRNNSGDMQG